MKKVVFLFAGIMITNLSYAQWTNGTNISNTNSGAVLINTTTTNGVDQLQINGYTYATGYKVPSGTGSQFLKANGTIDNSTYLTSSYNGFDSRYITTQSVGGIVQNGAINISGFIYAGNNLNIGGKAIIGAGNGLNPVSTLDIQGTSHLSDNTSPDRTSTIKIGPSSTTSSRLTISSNLSGNPNLYLAGSAGVGGYAYHPMLLFGDGQNAYGAVKGYIVSAFNSNGATAGGDISIQTTPDVTIIPLTDRLTVKNNGNVGVGTTSPTNKLQIASTNERMSIGDASAAITIGQWDATNNRIESFGRSMLFTTYNGSLNFGINGNTNLAVSNSGNVGIGTTNPDQKLSVAGTIHSQAVKVDMNGWSDYVFKTNYNLSSLENIKAYIDKNHHLPDMPSEKEVVKEGIDLGEMNKKLLQKVEELTLYLIDQQKQINQLKQQIKNGRKQGIL